MNDLINELQQTHGPRERWFISQTEGPLQPVTKERYEDGQIGSWLALVHLYFTTALKKKILARIADLFIYMLTLCVT